MAKKRASAPRPYGRQGDGKTIKSLSLESDVASWAEEEAERRGMSFSAFVNAYLKEVSITDTPKKKRGAKQS